MENKIKLNWLPIPMIRIWVFFLYFTFNPEREIESESDKFKILMKGGGWAGSSLISLKRVIK